AGAASATQTPDEGRSDSLNHSREQSWSRCCAPARVAAIAVGNPIDRDGVMTARHYTDAVKMRVAAGMMLAMTGGAAAEGERTLMVGGALTYSDVPDHRTGLVGGAVDLTWWFGRLGLAVEAAARHAVDDSAGNVAVADSARILVADWLWTSMVEPRDVE